MLDLTVIFVTEIRTVKIKMGILYYLKKRTTTIEPMMNKVDVYQIMKMIMMIEKFLLLPLHFIIILMATD